MLPMWTQRTQTRPLTARWPRTWSLGMALLLPLWAACNAPIHWSAGGQSDKATCNPWSDAHPELRDAIEARSNAASGSSERTSFEKEGVIGCLLVTKHLNSGDTKEVYQYKLGHLHSNGELKTWGGRDFVGDPLKLDQLNTVPGKGTYRFQFYALNTYVKRLAKQRGLTIDDLDDEAALMANFEVQFCGDVKETTYQQCLLHGGKPEQWCAFVLEFKPTSEGSDGSDILKEYPAGSEQIQRVGDDDAACVMFKPAAQPNEPKDEPVTDASEPVPESSRTCVGDCSFYTIEPVGISTFPGTILATSSTGNELVSCGSASCTAYTYAPSTLGYTAYPIKIASASQPITSLQWAPKHNYLVAAGLSELKVGTLAQYQTGKTPFFVAPFQSGVSYTKGQMSGDAKRLYALTKGTQPILLVWKFDAAGGTTTNEAAPVTIGKTDSTTSIMAVHPSQYIVAVGEQRTKSQQNWGVTLYQEDSQGNYNELNWLISRDNKEPTSIEFHPSGKWLLLSMPEIPQMATPSNPTASPIPPILIAVPIPIPDATSGGVKGIEILTSTASWSGAIQEIRFSPNGELMTTLEVDKTDPTKRRIRLWRFIPGAVAPQPPFTEIGDFPNLTSPAVVNWASIAFGRGCNEFITLTFDSTDTIQHWRCTPR